MNEIEKKMEDKLPVVQAPCSICEEDGKIRLRVEMPGVSKEGIEVSVEKNELAISGKVESWETPGTYLLRERRHGEFRKRFIIDDTIDREKIDATVVNGVLTLTLNTKETAKPRKIEIK